MKKIIVFLFFISAMCCVAFAQSQTSVFDKAKQIKLLESTRADVKKILADFKSDFDEEEDGWIIYSENFSNKDAEIRISYSIGDCSDDADKTDEWNVPEGKVKLIEINFIEIVKLEDFKFNFSNFKKEGDEDSPESFNYLDEKSGIVFKIDDGEIQQIILYPPKSKSGFLCVNERNAEVLSKEKRLVDLILNRIVCVNGPADVTDVALNKDELIIGCNNAAKNKSCPKEKTEISVITTAIDPENDVLTYNYTVSAGKIVGQGAKVIWDLAGVKAGTYTITAGVDDGCGVCGKTQTKTIVVKECPDCSAK